MNERIQELALQAGMGFGKPYKQTKDTLYIKSDKVADAIATDADTHQEQVLKLAELIVEDVLQLIATSDAKCRNEWDIAERDLYAEIQKHFGVE